MDRESSLRLAGKLARLEREDPSGFASLMLVIDCVVLFEKTSRKILTRGASLSESQKRDDDERSM